MSTSAYRAREMVDAQKLNDHRADKLAQLCTKTYKDFGSFLGSSLVRPFHEGEKDVGRHEQIGSLKEQEAILHELAAGEAKRGAHLDPVIFIDPTSITHAPQDGPVLYGDDGKRFTIIRDDGRDSEIREHYFVSSSGDIKKLSGGNENGTKVAYYFYGKTGMTPGNEEGRDTYMGTAILEPASMGIYHLDVGFKGSRSGRVRRKESAKGIGNADWATDISSQYMVEKPDICKTGHVAYGFAESYCSCIDALTAICVDAHKKAKQNDGTLQIETTGHSLGGALCTNFWSAMHFGTFKDSVIQYETLLNQNDHQAMDEATLTNQWSEILSNSRAVSFSAPPTHGADAIDTMRSEQPDTLKRILRIYAEDDPIPKGMGKLAKLVFSGEPEGLKEAVAQGKVVKSMKVEHVPGEIVSLGVIVKSKLPTHYTFLKSDGAAHMHSVNEAKIKEMTRQPVDLAQATWAIADVDLNLICGLSQTATHLLPEEYALLAAKINFEGELSIILATLGDKSKPMAVRTSDLLEILKLIKRSDAVGGEFTEGSIGKMIPGLIDLERDLKFAPNEEIYTMHLNELQQLNLILKDMVKANPSATALHAVSQNVAVLCACHTKSSYKAIQEAYAHFAAEDDVKSERTVEDEAHHSAEHAVLQVKVKLQQIQFEAIVEKSKKDIDALRKKVLFASKNESEQYTMLSKSLDLITTYLNDGEVQRAEELLIELEWEIEKPELIGIVNEVKKTVVALMDAIASSELHDIRRSQQRESYMDDIPETTHLAESASIDDEFDIASIPVVTATLARDGELQAHFYQLDFDPNAENTEGSSVANDDDAAATISLKG